MSRDLKPRLQTKKPKSGSRGSTLVGIFVGLILGALVAAGIALYFTASSPFQKPKQEERPVVPPPPKPQGSEPIALPGKAGDKPVEKPRFDFYNVLPKGSDACRRRPNRRKPRKSSSRRSSREGREGGWQARERCRTGQSEAALLDKPAVPEKFFLQAGSFEDPSEADNLKARLALMGVEASVQKVELPEKGTVHRVRVGPYLGQEEMTKARQQLSTNGINAAIIKIKPKEPKPATAAQ